MKVNKIRLNKKGIHSLLSPLETDILLLLWKLEQAKVKDIHKMLKRKAALTSVAVTLDRLHQKGVVSRTVEKGLGGGHYIYCPKSTRHEFEESVIDHTVNRLMNNFGAVAANYFHRRFSRRKK
ncbi:MAG: BlaI/MecI/CopY family transcriptional regulator [Candidatus Aenigmarchaeota archaeon]|nr:BlaI/MecI/CopY family transcriptional regulator [Candidatus Aenigmarchaeota archaeon]MDI6722566.1 BlaI/MecI/CopY family transcriptional regulator [Candidatus Aenigmarchaeota archaeon]